MKIRDYFRLFFVIAEVGNLDKYLGVTLVYFIMANVGNLLKKDNRFNGYYD